MSSEMAGATISLAGRLWSAEWWIVARHDRAMAYSPARMLPPSDEEAGSAVCRCRGDER